MLGLILQSHQSAEENAVIQVWKEATLLVNADLATYVTLFGPSGEIIGMLKAYFNPAANKTTYWPSLRYKHQL